MGTDMAALNETHDPARRSWVDAANRAGADFPIQNLPFGVFHRDGERPRGGVAIGDRIVDLAAALAAKLFSGAAAEAAQAASAPALNDLWRSATAPLPPCARSFPTCCARVPATVPGSSLSWCR